MDKSWIMKPQMSAAYEQEIVEFINFALRSGKWSSNMPL
jgi:hypothetical protein